MLAAIIIVVTNKEMFFETKHVGSTSVHGLCAKPILDLLLLVKNSAEEHTYVPALEKTDIP